MRATIWNKITKHWIYINDVRHINNIEESDTFEVEGTKYPKVSYSLEFIDNNI